LLGLGLALTAACRAEPGLDGSTLRCEDGCPSGMRCIDGLCLHNSLPRIRPFSAQQVVIGNTFTIDAEVKDPDPDDVAITWTQVEGPTVVLPEPLVADALSFPADTLGLYVFELSASDGFGAA